MVELSGHSVRDEANPDGDIEIRITGLRPGEKLYEELLIGDNPLTTAHPRIMKARESFPSWEELWPVLAQMRMAIDCHDPLALRDLLKEIVNGYQPSDEVVDWILSIKRA